MLSYFTRTVLFLGLLSPICWGTVTQASETKLKMSLPDNAIIQMNDGNRYSGVKISSVDATSVTFTKGGVTKTLPKSDIKGISFSGDYVVYASDKVVRGNGLSGCEAIAPIQVDATQLAGSSSEGVAIDPSSLERRERLELGKVSASQGFVIQSISFEDGKMQINSKACSP